jgi:hypothetical protein
MATLGVHSSVWQDTYTVGTGGVKAGQPVEADGSVAEAAEAIIGIAMHDADAEDVDSVLVIGEITARAGGAIAAGAEVEVGTTTDGVTEFVTLAAGVKVGRALTAAAGDGSSFRLRINAI